MVVGGECFFWWLHSYFLLMSCCVSLASCSPRVFASSVRSFFVSSSLNARWSLSFLRVSRSCCRVCSGAVAARMVSASSKSVRWPMSVWLSAACALRCSCMIRILRLNCVLSLKKVRSILRCSSFFPM